MTSSSREHPNRLVRETSPYLLQHAYNPVDWYPWGEEALNKARAEDKPIFLSIGYSACHWCHVMEHESFENPDIASLMNRVCVNIKVDREERPDLDQIYMNAVLAMSGHGGWPMSVFLLPDLRPFFGGTYWPPESRYGKSGFRDVLTAVDDAWRNRRELIEQNAGQLTEAVARMSEPAGSRTELTADLLQTTVNRLCRAADRTNGGFGGAPKFPHPMDLRLLLRGWKRFGTKDALDVVTLTLDKMAAGGIYDHLGGGFARYSTDERWLVPHFEKMLYDNALLMSCYVEAWQATHLDRYRIVVADTVDYLLREMTHPDGGFYSTQDADSEGVEGKFFVWTREEIRSHLSPDDAAAFELCFDVTAGGNWQDPHGHGPEGPNTILNRRISEVEAAARLGMTADNLNETLRRCRETLFRVRGQRVPPGRDEKILASWNGLMLSGLGLAAQAFDEPKYRQAASRAADFVLANLLDAHGRLFHVTKNGRSHTPGMLDDSACLIDGLVEVYQATFDPKYMTSASALAQQMVSHFRDPDEGGFFYTADDHEELIVRQKDANDNATPSGNGMAACALLKLARLTGRAEFEGEAVKTLEMLSGHLAEQPMAGGQSLLALDFLIGPTHEIVAVDGRNDTAEQLLRSIQAAFLPNKVVLRRLAAWSDEQLPPEIAPLLRGKESVESARVFLCEQGTCRQPIEDHDELSAFLGAGPSN